MFFSKKSLVFHGTECPKDMLHKQYQRDSVGCDDLFPSPFTIVNKRLDYEFWRESGGTGGDNVREEYVSYVNAVLVC